MKKGLPYFAFAFLVLFSALALTILLNPEMIQPFDSSVHALIHPLQTALGIRIFTGITFYGGTVGIILVLLVIVAAFRHRPDIILRLLIALGGSAISAEYLKMLFHRVRPDVFSGLAAIHSYSFPSGHANSSVVLYGFLALLMFVHARRASTRALALVLPAIAILLIGISRIVLQYHFATDVLGGYLLGAFWLTFSLAIPIWFPFYHYEENKSEPIERPLL